VALGVTVLLGGFVWVNVRFIRLAVDTQPDCVPHLTGGAASPGEHRAARSWC